MSSPAHSRSLTRALAGLKPTRVDIVKETLAGYAARGVFRSYSEIPSRGPEAEFRFRWFRDAVFRIQFDARSRTLTFPALFPEMVPRSAMDRDSRTFVRERSAPTLPAHRRIDPRRLGVTCVNRRGAMSLVVKIKGRDVEYGVRKAVHLVQDIFMDFLNDSRFAPYLVENFNLDPELV